MSLWQGNGNTQSTDYNMIWQYGFTKENKTSKQTKKKQGNKQTKQKSIKEKPYKS